MRTLPGYRVTSAATLLALIGVLSVGVHGTSHAAGGWNVAAAEMYGGMVGLELTAADGGTDIAELRYDARLTLDVDRDGVADWAGVVAFDRQTGSPLRSTHDGASMQLPSGRFVSVYGEATDSSRKVAVPPGVVAPGTLMMVELAFPDGTWRTQGGGWFGVDGSRLPAGSPLIPAPSAGAGAGDTSVGAGDGPSTGSAGTPGAAAGDGARPGKPSRAQCAKARAYAKFLRAPRKYAKFRALKPFYVTYHARCAASGR